MSNHKKLTKTIVLNNTGNVGKTFITREILAKFDPNAYIMEIETHNSSNKKFNIKNELKQFNSMNFQNILENFYLYQDKNLIVDVGSSDILKFIDGFKQLRLIDNIFDVFIVPTTAEPKQIDDTMKTIAMLLELNVTPTKIKVICNKTDTDDLKFKDQFELIIKGANLYKYIANDNLRVRESDSIKIIEEQKLTIEQFLKNDKDYLKLMSESKDQKEIRKLSKILIATQALKLIQSDLKMTYNEIYK